MVLAAAKRTSSALAATALSLDLTNSAKRSRRVSCTFRVRPDRQIFQLSVRGLRPGRGSGSLALESVTRSGNEKACCTEFKESVRNLACLGFQETLNNSRLGIEEARLAIIFLPQMVKRG